ncbi:unnamed protein product [Linum tenue]|uniref:Oxysterol-binding protein n=1 Tax=Linum tenue TaxID=586396 RepID=A0AAV0R6L7_9ROSI|nr:unnamed protein product [Linum tenue]
MEIGIDKPKQVIGGENIQGWNSEERKVVEVVLTKPLMVAAGDDSGDVEYRTPNLVQRVLSLFKNVRPGSDLTSFQLPPSFNYPKSELQAYGEMVYCAGKDILGECGGAGDPLERFTRVVVWSISTNRPAIFGVVPYNPVLGETHHVSARSLNVRLEQVSHHPPVTALHATDHRHGVNMLWFQRPVPKFQGTRVEVEVQGKRTLKLVEHGETYVMNSPNMTIRFIPPAVDWTGTVKVSCRETGYEAELNYPTSSFFLGRRSSSKHSVTGKIYKTSSPPAASPPPGKCNNNMHSTVKIRDPNGGGERVIYNAKEVASKLKAPILKDPQSVLPSESASVWSEVSRGILSRDWEKAKEAKRAVEEKQREMAKARKSRGEVWVPKYFTPSNNGGDDPYEYSPIEKLVPPAPIVVPF